MMAKRYTEDEVDRIINRSMGLGILIGMAMGTFFLSFALALLGAFDSPIRELGIEDELVESYIVSYYPEFENCSFEFRHGADTKGNGKVNIYCNDFADRDGLVILEDQLPTKTVLLRDITLEEIFESKLDDVLGRVSE